MDCGRLGISMIWTGCGGVGDGDGLCYGIVRVCSVSLKLEAWTCGTKYSLSLALSQWDEQHIFKKERKKDPCAFPTFTALLHIIQPRKPLRSRLQPVLLVVLVFSLDDLCRSALFQAAVVCGGEGWGYSREKYR